MAKTKQTPKKRLSMELAEHSDAVKARALVAYRESGVVSYACIAAKVARATWYDWMQRDETFAKQVLEAREDAIDDLEKEAVKRAKDGSDTLLIFLLKSLRRGTFGEKIQLNVVSPEVQTRLQSTVSLIAEKAPALLPELEKIWSN